MKADYYTKTEEDALLATKAPTASPAFTGTPTAPTAAAGTNTTQIATTAFVNTGIANAYQRTCNPNLLDNWYFVGGGSQQGGGQFPINQRGQTSYSHSSTAYGIDRWQDSRIAVTVNSNGLSIAQNTSGYDNGYIKQYIETQLAGKKVAISALLSSGDLIFKTGTLVVGTMLESSAVNGCKIGLRQSTASSNTEFFLWNYSGLNVAKKVVAVKLELGSTQTLCHNEGTDANPTWVLNEIPSYGEQYARCITSKADSGDTYANQPLLQSVKGKYIYITPSTTTTITIPYRVVLLSLANTYYGQQGLYVVTKKSQNSSLTITTIIANTHWTLSSNASGQLQIACDVYEARGFYINLDEA